MCWFGHTVCGFGSHYWMDNVFRYMSYMSGGLSYTLLNLSYTKKIKSAIHALLIISLSVLYLIVSI